MRVARFSHARRIWRTFLAGASTLIPLAAIGVGIPASGASAQEVSFRTYGVAEGLSNAWFACLKQDATGFIFTCTEHGLYVYDGRRFSNLGPRQGLPDGGIVEAMVIDSDRRIILRYSHTIYVSTTPITRAIPPERLSFVPAISTVGAISDGQAEQMTAWGDGAIIAARGQLFHVNTHTPDGRPRIETTGGMFRDQGIALQKPTPLAEAGSMLWLASAAGELCELGAHFRRCFGTADGLPAEEWNALLVEKNGHVAARSVEHLAEIDPESGKLTVSSLPVQNGPYANYPHGLLLAQTPTGLMVTQSGNGLIVRDHQSWRAFKSDNGMPSAPTLSILFDHEGNLWLGALGKGVMRALGYGIWDNIDHHDGLSNDIVWQMARAPGGPLWVATDAGVDAVGDAAGLPNLKRHYGRPSFALTTDAWGHVWRSEGSTGLACITPATGEVQSFQTPAITQILHGAGPLLWLFTEKGVYSIADTQYPTAPEAHPDLTATFDAAVVDADGSLWMLKEGRLVHRHNDGTSTIIKPHWQEAEFQPLTLARAKDGTLWTGGAGGGLYHLSLDGDRLDKIVRYGVPDIVSNTVVSILVDSRGWVWTGTDNGISVFNGQRWVSANTDSGLIWNDLDQGSLFEDADGSMWIGTSQGLSHLHDPTLLFKQQSLKPVITSVTIGDSDFRGPAVAFTRDPLEVRFGALNFEADGTVRFRYRLRGVDETWAETPNGYARYATIPPGHHAFEVIAYDPLTHQESAPVSILLRMKHPWWTWWPMLMLYGAAACALGYGLLRLRLRMLMRQQHALQREVEKRTKEMREAQAALQILATQDSLTKLLTRGEIQARLVGSLIAENNHSHLTVGLIDIDHFKKINDRHGHLAGDEILEEMGRRMRQALKPDEYAGRYGGEEILVVLMSQDDRGTDRIRELNTQLCGEPFIVDGQAIHVTVSIGVASARARDSWKSLIGRADKALYEAKGNGRNCMIVSFGTRDGELLSRYP